MPGAYHPLSQLGSVCSTFAGRHPLSFKGALGVKVAMRRERGKEREREGNGPRDKEREGESESESRRAGDFPLIINV